MFEKLNVFLNFLITSFVGAFIGFSIHKYLDYIKHPDLYAMQSAPWYTSIQINGLVTAVIISLAILGKILIKRKQKNN